MYIRHNSCILNSCDYQVIVSMKTGLFTCVVVCISVCVLFIKLLSVNARCWVHCPAFQLNELQPYCYLNDEEGDRVCQISVRTSDLTELQSQNWNKVNLFINVSNSVSLSLHNRLSEYGLELRSFRNIEQVTRLEIGYNNLIMSRYILYNLQNLRSISCYQVAFPYFPPFPVNSELTYLYVRSYTIMSNDPIIRSGLISGLSSLQYLRIYPRNGGKITNNALSGLTALTKIVLENVVISDYVNILSPLVRLKIFIINTCGVSDISFLKQTPVLYGVTYISFGNNEIESFPADTFKNYTQLEELYMEANSISEINRFYSKSIKVLHLYQNQITHVSEDAFRDTPLLTYIHLYNNAITRLSSRTFEHLHQIKRIYLHENPLHCDCNLKWLYNVTQEYGIQIYTSLCATPPQHEGISALDSSLYTNCTEEQSYHCFNRTISCPEGSYCQDTRDSYKCVCEGDGVAFSRTLNQCVDYESIIARSCCQGFISNIKGQVVCVDP